MRHPLHPGAVAVAACPCAAAPLRGVLVTEAEVHLLLSQGRFAAPAFAYLPHVNAGTGAYSGRTVDAVAMGVWPSRGLELHGIEIKCSRSDWLRELRDPAKSEGILAYMDRWWLVTSDKSIVGPGELPPTWGWMAVHGTTQVRVLVDAPPLSPQPVSRSFLAAVLRNASRTVLGSDETARLVSRADDEGHRRGYAAGLRDGKAMVVGDRELRESVASFEAAAGFKITGRYSWDAERVGAVIAWWTKHSEPGAALSHALASLERAVAAVNEATSAIRADGTVPDFRR